MKVFTKVAEKASQPNLKFIPNVGFDFDDVIENVEKLVGFIFPSEKEVIKSTIEEMSMKYSEQIDNDYENFMELANETKSFYKWDVMYKKLTKGLDEPVCQLLDLYFQINMISNYDIYNDLLIHAYLEDIQPFYTLKS